MEPNPANYCTRCDGYHGPLMECPASDSAQIKELRQRIAALEARTPVQGELMTTQLRTPNIDGRYDYGPEIDAAAMRCIDGDWGVSGGHTMWYEVRQALNRAGFKIVRK